jgi:hypothetical protein
VHRLRLPRIIVAAAACFVLVACSSGSDSSAAPDHTKAKEGDVFLEALGEVGLHPFALSAAVAAVPAIRESSVAAGSATQGLRSVAGTTSGLYAGSATQAVCDAATAADSLAADTDKAQPWADALNADDDLSWSGGSKLAVDDLPTYLSELTPVLLQNDVRVTDHDFAGSEATPFQAVLERGTAVLVDTQGMPRVRCASVSPLTSPRPASKPKYRGDEWDGFDKTKLVTITPGRTARTFRVNDIHTHKLVTIPIGSPTGAVAATTSTTEFVDETTTTTNGRTTTTVKKTTTTTAHVATTSTMPTTTTTPPETTTTGP